MRIQRLTKDAKENLLEDLLKRSPNNYGQYEQGVQEILAHVKEEKDQAVFAYTKKFDHADITADNIKVTEEEIEEAYIRSRSKTGGDHPQSSSEHPYVS